MSDKTNIFASDHNESPAQVIRQTMSVSLEEGVPMISFATNRGKGSGAQVLPVEQFRDYVMALEGFASNGIPESEDENLTAAETVQRTIRAEDLGPAFPGERQNPLKYVSPVGLHVK